MKKIILPILVCMAVVANAQPAFQSPEEMAQTETEVLTNLLGLNNAQIEPVKAVLVTFYESLQKQMKSLRPEGRPMQPPPGQQGVGGGSQAGTPMNRSSRPDDSAIRERIQKTPFFKEREAKLKEILTADQWTSYDENRDAIGKIVREHLNESR